MKLPSQLARRIRQVSLSAVPVTFSLLAVSLGASAPEAGAQSASKPKNAATLAFNVTARVTSSGDAGTTQTLSSRVLTKGSRIRVQTELGDRPVVFLVSPPYLYKLIPSAKAGVRWRNDKLASKASNIDLQAMLRNPALIRSMINQGGAKRAGTATLNGTLVDIFTVSNWKGKGGSAKTWLRRSDALPVRMEARTGSIFSVVSWSNYSRNIPLSDSLFRVPAGYSIRESEGQPNLM